MKRLLIALSIFILLASIATGIYFLFFTPRAQAQRVADSTMEAAFMQDQRAFAQYTKTNDSDILYAAAHQRNYRLDSLAHVDETFYVRYSFSDSSTPRYARIAVLGGRIVETTVGDTLGSTPKDDTQEVTVNTNQRACLSRDNLRTLDSTRLYAKTIRGATMIFGDATALDYVNEETSTRLLERMSTFYNTASEKDFSFLIRGYIPAATETQDSPLSVVQNRTTKIQQDLIDRGIPRDRVRIGQPAAYNLEQASETPNDRYIIIDIINHCNN